MQRKDLLGTLATTGNNFRLGSLPAGCIEWHSGRSLKADHGPVLLALWSEGSQTSGRILPAAVTPDYRYILSQMLEKKSPISSRLPSLNSLRVFEAAARLESFAKAADELHVTHGAVSRQIKLLEAGLGVPLFERRNRAVFCTAQGVRLLSACSEALERLAHAMRDLQAQEDSLPLVVSCEPTIAMRWLIPRLARLRDRHPSHQVHLLTAGGQVDFVRDRVDVALRRNDFQWGHECHAEWVADELMGPVCVPAMREAVRAAEAVSMLHSRTRPSAWANWERASGRRLQAARSAEFEHFYLSVQAASAGLGVALGSAFMVHDELCEGRLVAPLGFVPDGSSYVLLSPVAFDSDVRRSTFLEWLREEMKASIQPLLIQQQSGDVAESPGLL